MGATDERAPAGMAPIAIGLGLTLIHLISIPVSNTSVNPARSTGPALISMDATAISQLWLFWFAPIVGAIIGAILYKITATDTTSKGETPPSSVRLLESDALAQRTTIRSATDRSELEVSGD